MLLITSCGSGDRAGNPLIVGGSILNGSQWFVPPCLSIAAKAGLRLQEF